MSATTTPAAAKQTVLVSLAVAGGIAAFWDVQHNHDLPSLRILVGAIFAGIFLTLLADFAPGVAAGIAATAAVATVLAHREIPQFITNLLTGGK